MVLRIQPGRKRGGEREQSCGGHILQRHIYYFTTALGKEAALGLCPTHSTNDNLWGDAVNIGEGPLPWKLELFSITSSFSLFCTCAVLDIRVLIILCSRTVKIILNTFSEISDVWSNPLHIIYILRT